MPPRVALLGFRGDAQETGDMLSWPMNYEQPLPDAAFVGLLLDSANVDPELTTRRRVDINKALDRGTTLVVFIGPAGQSGSSSPLGSWLLSDLLTPLGLSLGWGGPMDLTCERADMRAFFDDQVAHAILNGALPDSVAPLARTRPGTPDSPVASIRIQRAKCAVFLVPLRSAAGSEEEALRFIRLTPAEDEYPEYLDALDLGGEEDARTELQELQQRQGELEAQLLTARRAKGILHLRDMALQQEVVRFFAEELSVPAELVAGNREDFVLLDESGEDWCVGEVKGRESANVTKGDVNAITNHRSDRELSDDFPALLVMNTFSRRESLADRDEPLHPDVMRRAAEDHVVVVRTLDLVRVKQALSADNRRPLEDLLTAVGTGGGWFEVNNAGDFGLRRK
jgi:hypothetical protein